MHPELEPEELRRQHMLHRHRCPNALCSANAKRKHATKQLLKATAAAIPASFSALPETMFLSTPAVFTFFLAFPVTRPLT